MEVLVFLEVAVTSSRCNLLAEEMGGRILQLYGVETIATFLSVEQRVPLSILRQCCEMRSQLSSGDTHICRPLINCHHHFLKLVPHLTSCIISLSFFLSFFSNFFVIRFCRFGIAFWPTLAFYLLYVRLWVADATVYSELFSVHTFFGCNLVH